MFLLVLLTFIYIYVFTFFFIVFVISPFPAFSNCKPTFLGFSRYSVFRRVVNYYSDDPTGLSGDGEDAFDMRKPLSRDKGLKYVRENGENFLVQPEDVY